MNQIEILILLDGMQMGCPNGQQADGQLMRHAHQPLPWSMSLCCYCCRSVCGLRYRWGWWESLGLFVGTVRCIYIVLRKNSFLFLHTLQKFGACRHCELLLKNNSSQRIIYEKNLHATFQLRKSWIWRVIALLSQPKEDTNYLSLLYETLMLQSPTPAILEVECNLFQLHGPQIISVEKFLEVHTLSC